MSKDQAVFSFKTHVQQLTDGWNQLQAQADRFLFEADLAKAQKNRIQAAAEAQIQKLEAQLKQSSTRIQELDASEAKVQILEAQLKASAEAEAQVQVLQKDLKSRTSELDRFKTQVQGKLVELETLKNKALGVLAAEQARSSGLEQALASERASHSEKIKEQEARYHKDTNELRAQLAQAQAAIRAPEDLEREQARSSGLEKALASEKASHDKLKDHVNKFYAKWEERYHKDTDDLKAKLEQAQAKDKLEISKLQAEILRLTQLAESQEEQFKDLKVIQNTNLEAVKRQLKVKENEVVTLQKSLEAANWKLDTEQKKFEALQQEHRENAEFVMEMRDKNPLQVEIQLEKSQAEVRQVRGIVKEMEDKLKETEAKLVEAQAPKKRGRPAKAEITGKNVKTKKTN